MKKPFSHRFENGGLRISGSISLGIHLLLIFTAAFLFSGTEIRQTPTRPVKVILYPWEEKKKSMPKLVLPLPVKNQIERPVNREPIQDEKRREVVPKKEFEPPVYLPVQVPVRDVPVEEPKLALLPGEEEKMAKEPANPEMDAAFDKAPGLKKEENSSAPFFSGVLKRTDLSENASGQGAGQGPGIGQSGSSVGEPGHTLGDRRGRFYWRGYEEGRSVGQEGLREGGTGSGAGSGEGGSPKGGSQKGGGVSGNLFSFPEGAGGAYVGYAENPKPSYPEEARKKGMEGEVLLRVEVLANGRAGRLELKKSSGHEILDRSALTAVKEWKFTPAKSGNGVISCWVNIPIKFRLK